MAIVSPKLITKLALCCLLTIWISPAVAIPESIRIASRLDPNAILITDVDIVFVYDAELAENFPTTKEAWFSRKFMMTRTAGDKMDIVSTFVPQGFDAVNPPLPDRKNQALKVFVFAHHDDSRTAAFDISAMTSVLIEVDVFGILVSASD